MCRVPEALPYSRPSSRAIPLGDYTHILAFGVEEGSLVRRGHILNWREDSKGESDEEERGENLSYLYSTPISLWPHDSCQCIGCNWI
jgi:hypothetical protein